MSSRFGFAVIAIVLSLPIAVSAQSAAPATTPRHHARKKPVKQQAQVQPTGPTQPLPPSGPLPGFNLDQIPSSAPLVAYQSGQLTIVAQNSTLGDILRAVHSQTGANVDMPSNSTERVVGHFGPGPAREVLASLLNGSHFDYVLLGTAANPNALDKVVLIARPIGPAEQPAVEANAAQPQPANAVPFARPQAAAQAAEEASDDSADDSAADDSADQADDQAAQPAAAQPNGSAAPKTPEELLQQLQQQQQQLQQQQPGGVPGTPIAPGQGPAQRMPLMNNPDPQ
ncbi:MAG TPA: hypothetical protein VH079_13775 [Terriglobales bacterium]|nr:hypothetical protein [Terriglobales bacterium]